MKRTGLIGKTMLTAMAALTAMGVGQACAAETIGLAVPDLTSSFWLSAVYGAQKEAKSASAKLVLLSAGGDGNSAQQISQVQDLIQRGVKAIIIGATNGKALAAVTNQAVSAGIPVIGLSSPPASKKLASIVSADHYDMGKLQAECLGAALKGKGTVAMMAGPNGQVWADRRADGFRDTLKAKYPNIKIVAESRLADNRNAALKVAEDWAQRFPKLNGVYSATDDMAAGVIAAFKTAGRKDMKFSASNLSPTARKLIKSGDLVCTSIQKIVAQGRAAVQQALLAAAGKPTKPSVVTPALLVDASNVDSVDLSDVVAPSGYRP